MKPDDEKFLKDLAWSEEWFPWKNKRRVIYRDGGKAWDKLAIILSALALIVSGISAWASVRQANLTSEQFIAADRNRALQTVGDDLFQYCAKASRPPITPEFVKFKDEHGDVYEAAVFTRKSLESVPIEKEVAFFTDLDSQYVKLGAKLVLLGQWLPKEDRMLAAGLMFDFSELFIPSRFNRMKDKFRLYKRLIDEAPHCANIVARLSNTLFEQDVVPILGEDAAIPVLERPAGEEPYPDEFLIKPKNFDH